MRSRRPVHRVVKWGLVAALLLVGGAALFQKNRGTGDADTRVAMTSAVGSSGTSAANSSQRDAAQASSAKVGPSGTVGVASPASPAPAGVTPPAQNPLPPIAQPYEAEAEIDLEKHYVIIKGHRAHPHKLLAKYRSSAGEEARAETLASLDLKAQAQFPLTPQLVVLKPANPVLTPVESVQDAEARGRELLKRIETLASTGQFEYVEPDYIITIDATPTDSAFTDGTLWGLRNTGQSGGFSGADIDVVRAWDTTTGSTDVVVAVIDTGVRYTHQELATQMWRNPDEIAGNGVDDDRDGYVDNIYGINGITNSGDPLDDHGHGTHCAGTIGARANGGGPHVGVAWSVKIMACKFLAPVGGGTTSDAIKCINFAVLKGAHILSNSWGGGSASQALSDAIGAANASGVLFVAAAGNDGINTDLSPRYPSGYPQPNILSVAAIDRQDRLASFSNFGVVSVDIGAPGVSIYSSTSTSDSSYETWNGTSMATPHVSGVAALVLANAPDLSVAELKERILSGSTPTAGLAGKVFTNGRVNAHEALNGAPDGALEVTVAPNAGTELTGGATTPVFVYVRDFTAVTNATVTGTAGGGAALTFVNDGAAPDAVANDNIYTASVTLPTTGSSFSVQVQVSATGKTTHTSTHNYTLRQPPANDAFAARVTLTGNASTVTGSNVGATRETGEPFHNGTGGKSVWWTWTATANGTITFRTTGSSFDTVLGVYTGTAVNTLTRITSDDDSGEGLTSLVTFDVTTGATYQIAVDGFGGSAGNITLITSFVAAPVPPANDNFSAAVNLTGASPTATGTNLAATKETGEPAHAGNTGGRSVWWQWTAPTDGIATVTTDSSLLDTTLGIYVGTAVSSLTTIASDNDSGEGSRSQVSFGATAGTTYRIAVDGLNGAAGDIMLALSLLLNPPVPANDSFVNRTTLAGSAAAATGTTIGATKESGEPDHAQNSGGKSIWWTWTAPSGGTVTINTAGSNFDTLLGIYTGTSVNNLTLVAGNDQDPVSGASTSRVMFNVTAGTTYQIAVDGVNTGLNIALGSVSLNLTLSTVVLPPNDLFGLRTVVSGNVATLTGSNVGATAEVGEPSHYSSASKSIWWSWTPTISGTVVITTEGSAFDTVLAVYTGSALTSLVNLARDDDSGVGVASLVSIAVTAGTTYQIAVDGLGSSSGSVTLNVNPPIAPPVFGSHPTAGAHFVGNNLFLSASVTSSVPTTYQWKKDGVALINGSRINGATSTYLNVYSLVAGDAGSYTLTATNAGGSMTSNAAVLTVLLPPPPFIQFHPSNQSIYVSQSIYLSVSVTNSYSVTYQWQKSTDGGVTYANIPNAVYSYFNLYNAATSDSARYRVIVTNAGGSSTSNAAVVTVSVPPVPSITTQPANQTLYLGQSFNLWVGVADHGPVTYQWQKSTNGGVSFTHIVNATYSSYYLSNVVAADAGQYRVVITNQSGSTVSAASVVTVGVPPPPVVVTPPASQTIYLGEMLNFSAGLTTYGPATYQWQRSVNGGVTFTDIPNATSSYFYLSPTQASDAGQYRIVATNAGGSTISAAATATLQTPPVPTFPWPASGGGTFAAGNSAYLSAYANGRGAITYQWQKDGVNLVNGSRIYGADSSSIQIHGLIVADAGVYRVIATNAGGSVTSSTVTIAVTPPPAPTLFSSPASSTVIAGGNANFFVSASGVGLIYQWQKDGVNLANGTRITGATSNSLRISGVVSGDAGQYRAIVSNDGGSLTSNAATLTVTIPPPPIFSTQPADATLQVGATLSLYGYASSSGSIAYQWYKDDVAIAGATANSYSRGNVSSVDAGVYKLAATNGGGTVFSRNATVTVVGSAAPRFVVQPVSMTAEVGDLVTLTASATGNPSPAYQWLRNGTAIAGAMSASYSLTAQSGDSAAVFSVRATNALGSISSQSATLTVYAAGSGRVLGLTPVTRTVGAGRVVYPLTIRSNSTWTATKTANWIALSATSGTRSRTIEITVAPNPLPVERTATITVGDLVHTLTQRAAGTAIRELWATGENVYGQLGDSSLPPHLYPLQADTSVKAVAAAADHSLYLKADGTVWAMGNNGSGQLGDGTTVIPRTPVQVATGVQSMSTGLAHTLFLKTDGTLWTVGSNVYGQLGDGTTTSRPTPVQVATGVQAVAAGGTHTLFLKTDGTLWGVGYNLHGQLGDGTMTSRSTPIQIATGIRAMAAGYLHTLFLKTDGTLWGTGQNNYGQLGSGSSSVTAPVQIAVSVKGVAAGGYTSFFIKNDDSLWGCGYNFHGQLGVGNPAPRIAPVSIAAGVRSVVVGIEHTLFIKTDNSLWGCGDNLFSELGDGSTVHRLLPVPIAAGVAAIALGDDHSLFAKTDDTLWVMGSNFLGQLGVATSVEGRVIPISVASEVQSVAAGREHTLFVKTDGTAWSVGANTYGQLADGSMTSRSTPAQIAATVSGLSAGNRHSLLLMQDGVLHSAGANESSQLGDGTTLQRTSPTRIATGVSAATAGYGHTLIRTTANALLGVGLSSSGQLGNGGISWSAPAQITADSAAMSAGLYHTVFVKTNGTLWTTGSNSYGQLGLGYTSGTMYYPTQVTTSASAVAAGSYHSLILKTDGSVWAMGNNVYGQLGDGTTTSRATPFQVTTDARAIASGASHSFVVKNDNSLWAFGAGSSGQLGNGGISIVRTPARVAANVQSVAAGENHTLFIASGDPRVSAYTPPSVTSVSPASPSAGGTVTITGTGFSDALGVYFNNVAATSYTVVSATQITAVAPEAQNNVTVTIGTFDGVTTHAATNVPPPSGGGTPPAAGGGGGGGGAPSLWFLTALALLAACRKLQRTRRG